MILSSFMNWKPKRKLCLQACKIINAAVVKQAKCGQFLISFVMDALSPVSLWP